ncbi:unnamed protein product [Orchesella dallaii]|uniref:Uncharacterized protein n=1 Tax=Orchesella dallaii TaxID=48710 RepID=A0ABP1QMU4_9HEXA
MSSTSTGAGGNAKDSKEPQKVKIQVVQNVRNKGFNKKLFHFTKKCEDMKRTARGFVALNSRIKQEIIQPLLLENQYLYLRNQLADAMSSGLMDAQLFATAEEQGEPFVPKLRHFELQLEQAHQKLMELVGIQAINEPGMEWVKSMILKDPERLQKEIDKATIKVHTGSLFFAQMQEEWDASKGNLSKEISLAIEAVGVLLLVIS